MNPTGEQGGGAAGRGESARATELGPVSSSPGEHAGDAGSTTLSHERRIADAIAAIGAGEGSDYVIAPSRHAEAYATSAPELAGLLRRTSIQLPAQRYEELDGRAIEAQKRFVSASNRARDAVFWAAVAGALLLGVGNIPGVLPASLDRLLVVGFSVAAVVASGLATAWIRSIREGKLLEEWMTRRAEAETERLRYFELVAVESRLSEPLLQLEYFRRYQLDVQRSFYRERGAQHRTAAERLLSGSGAAMAVAGIASGLAGVLGASIAPQWTLLAGVGLLAQAFASRSENREATAQHRRNAERYDRTRHTLERLYALLDDVRVATARSTPEVSRQFVASVHEQLSLEHRQWLDEIAAASEATRRLQDLLAESRGGGDR